MTADKKTNRLITESSPYLLQHAYNPVDWFPWGEEALQKANKEDKPIIVSIGYAACHWCHVMEHESFENEEIAQLMNTHFVCIKIDREERPDLDAIYMDAAHTMGLGGGWPLHVFLNSEAHPFYAGTYFTPKQWSKVLQSVANAYKTNREELNNSAEEIVQHLNSSELQKFDLKKTNPDVSEEGFKQIYKSLSKHFDTKQGGFGGSPKFPMPGNYLFLLRYYYHSKDEAALQHVHLSLRKMAYGGIYDQVGGGFARYAVDEKWLVPHFEKMLYDNAQLITLYSEAYQLTKEPLYKDIVYETIAFAERDLMSPEGCFYASLDADSEGVEGKFYVFTKSELQKILKAEEPLFSKYYNVTAVGNFEHGMNILYRNERDEVFAKENNLELEVLQRMVANWKKQLLKVRAKRVSPKLDDKILCSWNALMLKGLADAYYTFGNKHFLKLAIKCATFLVQHIKKENMLLHTYKNGKASINGFLEDYALLISALIRLYEVTFNEKWLLEARALTDYTLTHFFDKAENLFFFTDDQADKLIARKKEILDNVIPASNSVMGINLHFLRYYFDDHTYQELSDNMLSNVRDLLDKEPSHTSNWGILYFYKLTPTAEIIVIGNKTAEVRDELSSFYIPNMLLAGSQKKNRIPLLTDRTAIDNKTTIYVCFNKTCQLPVHTAAAALEQLKGQQESKFPRL